MTTYTDRLPKNHEAWWLEEVVESELGLITPEHVKEHEDMMSHWNIKYANFSPLNGAEINKINLEDNTFFYDYPKDRLYHLSLHVLYWKEAGIRTEYVKKFENQFGPIETIVKKPVVKEDDPKAK